MLESLQAIRALGLSSVFEDLYHGRPVPGTIGFYFRYPSAFHGLTLEDGRPLTDGTQIPIVADADFYEICFFDPKTNGFVLKALEEPEIVLRVFASWQQFLAHRLLAIADSAAPPDELRIVADSIGFSHTERFFALLESMNDHTDAESRILGVQFVASIA